MSLDAPARVAVSPKGRWGGALTSRPLPIDPSIVALCDAERSIIAEVWLARSASERRVGDAFIVVSEALDALGADDELRRLARRAVDDEGRHAELSRVVASAYAGVELPAAERFELTVPRHAGAGDRLRSLLHVVGNCCFNETLASAFLEAELSTVAAPMAAAALRELLSDEIDHARLGWAALAATDAPTRAAVQPWLLDMARANLRMWRTAPRRYAEPNASASLLAHGVSRRDAVDSTLVVGLRELVLPGLAHLGFDVSPMESWISSGAPT